MSRLVERAPAGERRSHEEGEKKSFVEPHSLGLHMHVENAKLLTEDVQAPPDEDTQKPLRARQG